MMLTLRNIIFLLAVLACSFAAKAGDTLQIDNGLTQQESATSMTWPMLPGESVNDVARMFYPKNKVMQKLFVAKTLSLSSDGAEKLTANQRFDEATLLTVPTIKSLSQSMAYRQKAKKKTLNLSYGFEQTSKNLPQKLLQQYEDLVNRNTFLKNQLAELKQKIVFLENKLGELKLIFDKTLTLPAGDLLSASTVASVAPSAQPVATQSTINQTPTENVNTKKVFKNLSGDKTHDKNIAFDLVTPAKAKPGSESKPTWLNNLNMDLVRAALAILVILTLAIFALKSYRQRMFDKLNFATTKMQNTVTDYSGYFEKTKAVSAAEESPEAIKHQQAVKEVQQKLSATLEEAKLLMSVNRASDAVAHLKAVIENQPKASINHWLYLLEVFRKLNLKDDFEEYANGLHNTFNVMKPVWYEDTQAKLIVVPQSLDEFPHIMEQLYGVWPGELASVYLRGLITDNRGGERAGFGKEVVEEILLLMAVLESRNELPD